MAWTTAEKLGAGVAGALVVGAIWFGGSAAQAATAPEGSSAPGPRPVPPAGTNELQPDPFPAEAQLRAMSQADRRALVRTAQFQLNALGYGPLAVDGIDGPQTNAAALRFAGDRHISDPGGTAEHASRLLLTAVDGAYRERFGLGPRLPSSGALHGRAARRAERTRGYGRP